MSKAGWKWPPFSVMDNFRDCCLVKGYSKNWTMILDLRILCFRWERCHSEEDIHKMGQQAFKEGREI